MNTFKSLIAALVSLFTPVPANHSFSGSDTWEQAEAKVTGEI